MAASLFLQVPDAINFHLQAVCGIPLAALLLSSTSMPAFSLTVLVCQVYTIKLSPHFEIVQKNPSDRPEKQFGHYMAPRHTSGDSGIYSSCKGETHIFTYVVSKESF